MKKIKYLQIASLILCGLMLVVGCAETPVEEPKRENEAPVIITADPIRSNFITIEQKENEVLVLGDALSDKYGELISLRGDLILFKKSEKDYMNNLTETYTVYSVSDSKEVKTIAHTYADEDYTRKDDFGNQVRPEKTVKVSIDELAYGNTTYIKVVTTTYTPIDEEIIENEKLTDSYSATYSIDYYDAKGTHITTTNATNDVEFIDSGFNMVKVRFGKTIALFDVKENKLVKTYDGDVKVETISYSYSNAKYDYYFGHPYGNVNYGTPIGASSKIIVRDKTGKVVLDYVCSDRALMASPHVIANGDIVIQYISLTDGIEYDMLMDGTSKVNVDTFIIDVETGTVKPVENFNYLISMITTKAEFEADALNSDMNYKVGLNEENVRNIALIMSFSEEGFNAVPQLAFVDDALNINYVFEKYCEEQEGTFDELQILNGGYILVAIEGPVSDRAIVKDGKIVTYVTDDMIVTDYAIIAEGGVYDFEMNLIWEDEDEGFYHTYNYKRILGKYAIYEAVEILTPEAIANGEIAEISYYLIDMEDGTRELISWDDDIRIAGVGYETDDLLIIKNNKTGKMRLVNEENDTLIVGDNISVMRIDGKHVVRAEIDGSSYVFTLNVKSAETNM